MSEAEVVARTEVPATLHSLSDQLQTLGLAAGQTVLVHSAMSQIGWIIGGAEVVIRALLNVLTPVGTLMMPTHSSGNTDPATWENPPVPEAWWPVIRAESPAYNPITTPTRGMGVIAEQFRSWPGVRRSLHPTSSFAALGPNARTLLNDHPLEPDLGDGSPLSKLYDLDGYILLLGVGHGNNTSLHLAEYRAEWPGKRYLKTGSAMLEDGRRQWVDYTALDVDSSDFEALGHDYEVQHPVSVGKVGLAEARLIKQRPLVDYAIEWLATRRSEARA